MKKIVFILLSFVFLASLFAMGKAEPSSVTEAVALQELFGTDLYDAEGNRVSIEDLNAEKIGIYFSAQWCPPCRQFTPILVDAYNTLAEDAEKSFAMVFVSSDRSEDEMYTYMREYKMPWYTTSYEGPIRQSLAQRFNVSGIPFLVIIDKDGNVLSTNARNEIIQDGAAAFDLW